MIVCGKEAHSRQRCQGRSKRGSLRPRTKKLISLVLLAVGVTGCGGSPVSSSISVLVSPSSAQVNVGGTVKFSATVNGTSNSAVTWYVNGKKGGNSSVGTIGSTGLYTAPATATSSNVTVAAVSQADANAKGTAAVAILTAATVTVSPAGVAVPTGTSQQFSATVQGMTNPAVTWSVNGSTGGNSTIGTIDANGLYVAPSTPPAGGTVTVVATSISDPRQSGSSTVSLIFGPAALRGQYAFLVKGENGSTALARVGSVIFDGNGNVTSGVEDVNSTTAASTILFNGGTYTVQADGRGTLSLTNSTAGTISFYIAMASNQQGFLVENDGNNATSGSLYKQNPNNFSNPGLSGSYLFDFAGVDTSGHAESIIGHLISDGAGHFPSGWLDQNDDGTTSGATSLSSSSYQMDATYGSNFGRGVAAINGLAYVFFIVDGTRAEFLETDSGMMTAGEVVMQQSTPTQVSALNGNFAFVGFGSSSSSQNSQPLARGGRFSADGNGNVSGVMLITNGAGTAAQVPSTGTLQGTYSIDTSGSGRGTMTFTDSSAGTFKFIFYLGSSGQAVFQDTSKDVILDGTMLQQSSTSATQATLAGSHAFLWGGVNNGENVFSGQMTLTATSSNNAKGTLDLNEAGTSAISDIFSGNLSVSGDGTARNNLNLTAANPSGSFSFGVFLIDANTMLLVSSDDKDVIIGRSLRQF